MEKRQKKVFAILVAVVLVLMMTPLAAFAKSEPENTALAESKLIQDEESGSLSTMAAKNIPIDATIFPDGNFRAWLLDGSNINGAGTDGVLTPDEIAEITSIIIISKNITSLVGIECFTALEELGCIDNDLTSLPKLPETLISLNCSHNKLTELPVLPDALFWLDCSYNRLISLDLTGLDSLAAFQGNDQNPILTLNDDSGMFFTAINLNTPVFGSSAISYADDRLVSTSKSVGSTPFTAQTGGGKTSSYTLSGILTLNYEGLGSVPLNVSGITIVSKTYDGQPITYAGTPVFTDTSGQPIANITLEALYESTDGSLYSSNVAPVNAGAYRLTFVGLQDNVFYASSQSSDFIIKRRALTVRAELSGILQGVEIPTFMLIYEGFVGGDNADNALLVKASAMLNITDRPDGVRILEIVILTQAMLNMTNGLNYFIAEHASSTTTTTTWLLEQSDDTTNTTDNTRSGSSLPQAGDTKDLCLAMLSIVLLVTGLGVVGRGLGFDGLWRRRYSRHHC